MKCKLIVKLTILFLIGFFLALLISCVPIPNEPKEYPCKVMFIGWQSQNVWKCDSARIYDGQIFIYKDRTTTVIYPSKSVSVIYKCR